MISVAMCTYNGEKFVEEQLLSILNQTKNVDEIIICDDNSSDDTVQIVENVLKNSCVNFRVIKNEVQKGVTKNFENALVNCNGDIIFLSDQDDVWTKNKVELMCKEMQRRKDGLLFFTDAYLVDENLNMLGNTLWKSIGVEDKACFGVIDFVSKRFVTGATVAIRRELLEYSLPIPECWIHDGWLAMNAVLYGAVYAINEKALLYRQHSSNAIGAGNKPVLSKIKYRWNNLEESYIFKKIMADRMETFVLKNSYKLEESERLEYEKCHKFWLSTYQIKEKSLVKGLKIIIANVINKSYKKYNRGMCGALVDLCILIRMR